MKYFRLLALFLPVAWFGSIWLGVLGLPNILSLIIPDETGMLVLPVFLILSTVLLIPYLIFTLRYKKFCWFSCYMVLGGIPFLVVLTMLYIDLH
ncbi:TPA: hypothetical protein ACX6QP_002162 [Photobacterium damselae]